MQCDPSFTHAVEIWQHRYELHARAKLNSLAASTLREGALLKLVKQDGATGYSDCHPWPEFGDETLARQLELLKRQIVTPLIKRSLILAGLDAQARAQSASLFTDRAIPPSHYLALDISELRRERITALADEGFTHIKCKAGPDLAARIAFRELGSLLTETQLKLRLDFNATLQPSEFDAFLIAAKSMVEIIDFIEDPCVYDAAAWKSARARYGVRLAIDRCASLDKVDPDSIDIVILKPAVDDPDGHVEFVRSYGRALCVTSYMDHPIGQMGAAYVAAELAHNYPGLVDVCGLLTHANYQDDHFLNRIVTRGSLLQAPRGTGIGFDDLLSNLTWTRLA